MNSLRIKPHTGADRATIVKWLVNHQHPIVTENEPETGNIVVGVMTESLAASSIISAITRFSNFE